MRIKLLKPSTCSAPATRRRRNAVGKRQDFGPRAEDGAADAHVRCAERHRRLVIVAHAHAELGRSRSRRRALPGRRNGSPAPRRPAECTSARPHRASARRGRARQAPAARPGRTPAFCGSSPVLTWMKSCSRLPCALHLLGERAGDLRPVDRVDGVEQLHRLLRLVRLQRADEMQLEIRELRFQLRPFALGLLHAVLAENALAGLQQRAGSPAPRRSWRRRSARRRQDRARPPCAAAAILACDLGQTLRRIARRFSHWCHPTALTRMVL